MPVYVFDRYVDSVKMAEGCKIFNEDNLEDAIKSAKSLFFFDSPRSEFKLRKNKSNEY